MSEQDDEVIRSMRNLAIAIILAAAILLGVGLYLL